MLYMITGPNGGGKTLHAIRKMHEYHALGVDVYASNFNNLRIPWVQQLPNPREWALLPENSVLFVDESQQIWPTRPGTARVPDDVRGLEVHRQGGIDIYLVTLTPTFIDSHIRPLIAGHWHSVAYGPSKSRIFKWAECQQDPQSVTARRNGEFEVWSHEKAYYDLYTSSTKHMPKPKAPFRQRINKVLFLLAGIISLWIAYQLYDWIWGTPKAPKAPGQATSGLASLLPSNGKGRAPLTLEQYLLLMQPRVPEIPGSAPIFDDRKVQAEPALYCMSSGDPPESCTCLTEQGTTYFLSQNPSMHQRRCAYLARNGAPYDPFKKPPREGRAGGSRDPVRSGDRTPAAESDSGGDAGVIQGPDVAQYGYFRKPPTEQKEAGI